MRAKVQVGDLVYHEITDKHGIVVELKNSSRYSVVADVQIEWFDTKRSWNFYDNVLVWKWAAEKRKLLKRKCK